MATMRRFASDTVELIIFVAIMTALVEFHCSTRVALIEMLRKDVFPIARRSKFEPLIPTKVRMELSKATTDLVLLSARMAVTFWKATRVMMEHEKETVPFKVELLMRTFSSRL